MRLNVSNYQAILAEKQISDEYVIKATGLSERTYLWILDNGFIECETLERIADAIGCPVGDILSPDYEGYAENVIEWGRNKKIATLSLSQRSVITKVKRLAEKYPEEVQIIAENKDGSLYAHMPVNFAIRIGRPAQKSEKQREAARLSISKIRQSTTK